MNIPPLWRQVQSLFSDAVHTVNLRGKFMQEAVPLGEGSMAAVIGLDPDRIAEVCAGVSTESQPVQAVNFNCPGQTVIAGAAGAVEKGLCCFERSRRKEGDHVECKRAFPFFAYGTGGAEAEKRCLIRLR